MPSRANRRAPTKAASRETGVAQPRFVKTAAEAVRFGAVLLVFLVPFAIDLRLTTPLQGSERLLECGAFALLALLCVAELAWPRRSGIDVPALAAAGLGGALLLSAARASNPAYSIASSLLSLSGIALFLVLRRSGVPASRLAAVVSLQAAVLSVLALTQWAGLDPLPYAADPSVKSRAVATFGNPNFLGSVLGPAIFVCLAHAASRSGTVRKLTLLAAGLAGLALVATRARAALLGTLVAFFLVAVLHAVRERVPKRRAVLLVSGCVLLAVSFVAVVRSARPAWVLDVNVESRLGFFHTASGAPEVLEGVGRGGFSQTYWDRVAAEAGGDSRAPFLRALVGATDGSSRTLDPGNVHNDYLELLLEGGAVALALHLVLVVLALSSGARRALSGEQAAGLLVGGLVVSLVDAAFGFPLALPASLAVFWVLVSLLVKPEEP